MDQDPERAPPARSSAKEALLQKWLRGRPNESPAVRIERRATDVAAASFAQRRLWFLQQLHPESVAYNMVYAYDLEGPLDVHALERAIGEILRRHEALRTTLDVRDGEIVQVVRPHKPFRLAVKDLRGLPPDGRAAAQRSAQREEMETPFDLAAGPVFRAGLLRLEDERHALVVGAHHVAFDERSELRFQEELALHYRKEIDRDPSPLADPPVQYADHARWQRERFAGERRERQLAYWRRQLAALPPLDLPTDRPRPATPTGAGRMHGFRIPRATAEALRARCKEEGATLFMGLLAGFQALLHRYAGQDDVAVATPVTGRDRPEVEDLIGFFVNTLVVRTDFRGTPGLRELLARVRRTCAEGYAHAETPFEALVEELQPQRDLGRPPLFQALFALQPAIPPAPEAAGLRIRGRFVESITAKVDLSLYAIEDADGFEGWLEYSTELFDAATVERMAGHLNVLLAAACAEPTRPIDSLDLLTSEERDRLAPAPEGPVAARTHAHRLFEAWARRAPERVALEDDRERLTYAELDARADLVARRLRAAGVSPGAVVGLFGERTADLVAGLLGVLKSGAAYLPLDPAYPPERLAFMLADASVRAILVEPALAARLPPSDATVLPLRDEAAPADQAPNPEPLPDQTAYVLFTSGSTGRPKGTPVHHAALSNVLESARAALEMREDDAVLALTTLSFDIATLELLLPLTGGARVRLAARDAARDPARILELLPSATFLQATPATWRMLVEAGWPEGGETRRTLRALSGGEALSPGLARALLARVSALWNGYGPTEAAIYSTFRRVTHDDAACVRVPIGESVANMRAYVLDGHHQPVPVGVPGELCIAGVGVSRGYLHRPELTAERFVPDPFVPGARMYRTGDLARWRADGTLDYLGRIDRQVKVRGFRIEPGEVEHAILQHPGVRAAVVTARGERLVAHVVGSPGAEALRTHLRARLPEHMVPSAFVPLDALPLTPNGKIDVKALPEPEPASAALDTPSVPPRTALEARFADAFGRALGLPRVGVHDDFFALGGHSLLAARLVAALRETGHDVPLRAVFATPTVAGLAATLSTREAEPGPRPAASRDGAPLSYGQRQMWFLHRLDPESPAYHMPTARRLRGPLDADALERALSEIVRRHEVLRTTFRDGPDGPVQLVHPPGEFRLERTDLAHLPAHEREAQREVLASAEAERPFDLSKGPVVRARLLRLASDDHLLLLTLHHAAFDEASDRVLLQELGALYAAFAAGRTPDLPEPALQYGDYALWQRERAADGAWDPLLARWRERLRDAPALDLPTDRARPAESSQRGHHHRFELGADLMSAAREIARAERTTPYAVLLAAYEALLHRHSGQDDFAVGTPVASRSSPSLEGLVGYLVNTVALRADLSGRPTFRELVARTRERAVEAQELAEVPFERVVEEVQPARDASRTPIFQAFFAYEAHQESPALPGISVEGGLVPTKTSKFDLSLFLADTSEGLSCWLEASSDLFKPETAARIARRFETLLSAALAEPDTPVARLPLMPAEESALVLDAWRDCSGPIPTRCVHELVAAQAARTPDAIAIDDGARRISYGELDARATRLARGLVSEGVRPGELVAVRMERSVDLVAALLGVAKAGAAYVPLDPSHPEARLSAILEDASPRLVLDGDAFSRLAASDKDAILPAPDLNSAAYVLHTSGSTGRPKGVVVGHGALANLLAAMQTELDVRAGDHWLAITTVSFDIAALELFLPLVEGATVRLASRGEATDPRALAALAADATLLQATPSTWRMLLDSGWAGEARLRALCGGEALPADLARRLRRRVGALWNVYGPTETTIWSTLEPIERDEARVSIGRPLPNTRVYVVDANGQPVPPGVPGELLIGGLGVAEGYLGRPDLTAERFVPDPFAPGTRVYRTGDLVRWRADGRLEHLGRMDRQVKVRGVRLELGEVEDALRAHPAVRDAVATLRADPGGDAALVAYVIPIDDPPGADALRAFLRASLPDAMVPSLFVPLERLPLTPNGKIDVRALPDPTPQASAKRERLAPRTPEERAVATLWSELLRVAEPGIHDDFFLLGGHSLLATQLASRLRADLGVDVPLRALLTSPTIEAQARLVESCRAEDAPAAKGPHDVAADGAALSFGQERMVFLHQLDPASAAYNMAVSRRLRGPLDVPSLERALSEVVRRHAPLRTTFRFDGAGRAEPVLQPARPVQLGAIDVSAPTLGERERAVVELASREAHVPFDLATGPLLRARLYRLDAEDHVLVVALHHVAFDEWSERVLLDELRALYTAFCERRAPDLPPPVLDYARHAARQRKRLQDGALDAQIGYWLERLRGLSPLDLPADKPRPAQAGTEGGFVAFEVPAALATRLRALCRRHAATPYMGLLAAFHALLHRYTGEQDIAVGTPVSGRASADVEELVGFFVNTLVLRADLSGEPTFDELLAQVRDACLDAYANQEAPFERLADELAPTRDPARTPLFQVAFLHQGEAQPWSLARAVAADPFPLPARTAKFELTLGLAERGESLDGFLEYRADLFERATAERMARHYVALLDALTRAPERPVAQAPLLTSEDHALLETANATQAPYGEHATIHSLVEAQVARTPHAVALRHEGQDVTYAELDARANRLARRLAGLGVEPGDLVGLCARRGVGTLVAILATLKLGAAYLPLDPAYPPERLSFMVEDARPRLVLTEDDASPRFALPPERRARLDALEREAEALSPGRIETAAGSRDLAYVIYTSGSTGRPKGVLLEHLGASNLAAAQASFFGLGPGDRVLQFASLSFDASVWELLMALTTGATLVIPPREAVLAGPELASILADERITIATLPPSALATLPDEPLDTLRTIVVAGEACAPQLVAKWRRGRRFVNAYGPTESTVCSTWQVVERDEARPPPIGRPLPNLEAHVLDGNLQPTPVGVPGELYVGGVGLARGYLNRPALDAERFLPHRTKPGERLYRTGDLARRLPDGSLEFLGRLDHQVKIRGFRIELGEVEAALLALPGVREAVAVAREDRPGEKRLVAYLAPATLDARELRRELERALPAHMVPAAFLALDALPLTSNGKVDRKALPAPEAGRANLARDYTPPGTPAETVLAEVWKDVLRVERVGIHDNFFELGGDSILSIQVVARAGRRGVRLATRDVFHHQTVAALAAVAAHGAGVTAEQGLVSGEAPLTPIQRWFFSRDLPARHQFNQSLVLDVPEGVTETHLRDALEALLAHHDALRLRFAPAEAGWQQTHAAPDEALDGAFAAVQLPSGDERAWLALADAAQASLDPEQGRLVRAVLASTGAGPRRLLLAIHHLAVDVVSWSILLEDLDAACRQRMAGEDVRLPPKTTSYKAWSERLAAHARSDALRGELAFWRDQTDLARLPRDRDGPNRVASEEHVEAVLTAEETDALLREVPRAYRAHVREAIVAALAQALARWTGRTRALLEIEGHGREDLFADVDLSRTVGWFTTLHPLVVDVDPEDAVGSLRRAKRALRAVPHRGIGHGLLRHLAPSDVSRALAQAPEPEVSLNYMGQLDGTAAEGALFRILDAPRGREHSSSGTRHRLLEINGGVSGGRLVMRVAYSRDLHDRSTIERLATGFVDALRSLVAQAATVHLPQASDFPLANLDEASLARLLEGREGLVEDLYPLTPMQQGMLYHSLRETGSGVYVEQTCLRLAGAVESDALRRAWQRLVDRHDILRAGFAWTGLIEPLHVVHRRAEVPFEVVDWRDVTEAEREARLDAFLHEDRARGFALDSPPLLRLTLVRFAEDDHCLVWTNHHTLFDGWSLPIVLREVALAYEAFRSGAEPSLPPARPFREFVAHLRARDAAASEAFWRRELAGFDAPTPLTVDHAPRAERATPLPTVVGRMLSPQAMAKFDMLARHARVTPNAVLQGAWGILLARYGGRDDVVFGATVAGRPADLDEVESRVGLFINTLPVRVRLREDAKVADWLSELQAKQSEQREHEQVSLTDIRAWSDVPAGSPLFESLLVFENYPWRSDGLELLPVRGVKGLSRTNFPLALIAGPGERLTLQLHYDPTRFEDAAIERMLAHLERLIESLSDHADDPLAAVELLTPADRERLDAWARAPHAPAPRCIHEIIREQASRTPDATAVESATARFTYRELEEASDAVAGALLARGVERGELVALATEPDAHAIAAMLGVLKAGAAYVPVDPAYPAGRIAHMIEDSGARLVLTQARLAARFATEGRAVLAIDEPMPETAAVRSLPKVDATDLAYVIYTSGSTGLPKGVLVEHRGAASMVEAHQATFGLARGDRVLQFASWSFDAAFWEVMMALGSGATLCMPPARAAGDELQRFLQDARITAATLTPSALKSLRPEGLEALRTLVTAGEELPRDLADAWASGRRLFNAYGPTETTVCATIARVEARDGPITIGGAFGGARVRILDARLRPVPPGVPGEICVGGDIVARGYHNRSELTSQRFVENPAVPGERLYRTGDLGRWLEDGCLEFLGRLDHQVKIRGFRIEPGEIEAALRAHPQVADACVLARPDARGEARLVAYVLAHGTAPDAAALREHLAASLPPHMVPSAFVALSELPQTPNGKLDRKALPDPETADAGGASHTPPRDPVERILADVWRETLGIGRVGVHDDFFLLGGHSLNATRVASRIREALGVELPLRTLFAARTVEGLAREVRALQGSSVPLPPVVREAADGPAPLSFAQQRLWFLSQWEPESAVYNIPAFYRLAGPLDAHALERALGELTRRHEVLRTVYALGHDGRPTQIVQPHAPLALEVTDLASLPEAERAEAARRIADEEARRPYDLARGPVFRARLLRVAPREHWLLMGFHHIAFDGWSVGVLLPELGQLYRAYSEGATPRLPDLAVQYADFARWQRAHFHEEALAPQLAYWRSKLAKTPVLDLPTDRPRPKVQTFRGAHRWFSLPETLLSRLQEVCREEGATLFMGLLAAYQALLHRYTAQTDFAVGTPISGRTRAETEGLIGFFVNTLVLRADLSGEPTFRELLRRVREGALEAYAHQDAPFERIVTEVQPERDTTRSPLFQAMFVLQDDVADSARWANILVSGIPASSLAAKFDLTLFLANTGERLEGIVEYRTDLFETDTIDRFTGHLETLLAHATRAPDEPLARLSLLPPDERERVLESWNRTETPFKQESCVHELAEAHARETPDAPALLHEGRAVSYAELDASAARVSAALRAAGVQSGDRVALLAERSPDAIAAMLGILQAGATYVPLDPRHPPARHAHILDDAQVRLVLVSAVTEPFAPAGAPRLRIDALPDRSDAAGPLRGAPEQACYVIYTSGSTGQPKGVVVEHRNACNLVVAARERFGFGPGERILQFASPAFDGSIIEILGALGTGACLVLPRSDSPLAGPALAAALDGDRVTIAILPPAAIATLDETPAHLRTLVSAGEALSAALAARWAPRVRLLNGYGPTECTVGSTSARIPPGAMGAPSIGRPFPNARAYVLDARREPVPIGVAGELYIGGAGVARGYLGRDDLTRERFLPDPFHPGGRVYRTGDLARWRSDGELEFLGRADEQVKIRGFRVEPGEIEAALKRHPAVGDASIVAREDDGLRRLVAYVVPAAGAAASTSELREHLGRTLPDHMVPAVFVTLPVLPLTSNGKVDRKALPAPDASTLSPAREHTAPRTPTEAALVEAWRETLRLDTVGVEDNFFELGGDSILSITAIARAAQRGVHVTPKQLFEHQTIAAIARALDAGPAGGASRLAVTLQHEGAGAPFFCVHPVGGGVGCYLRLARDVGPSRRFVGLQAPGLDPGSAPLERVEDLAQTYVAEVRALQPQGPYLLGGWSFGALVAHEMTRQLLAAGEHVEALLLLDPPPPHAPGATLELGKLDLDSISPDLLPQLGLPPDAANMAPDAVARHLEVLRAHVRAHAAYRPSHVAVPARLVVSEDSLRRMPHLADDWRGLVATLDAATVPGNHVSIMTDAVHVRTLAQAMRRALGHPEGDA